ncbi:MAG: hypothetical protein RIB67_07330 [Miltoncostaeaceae bacterium]
MGARTHTPELACSVCGCTDERACRYDEDGACWWVHGPFDDPLCSACAAFPVEGS